MRVQYVQGKPIFTSINKNIKQYPYLSKNIESEVCIIGGGVTGAIAAYYLATNNIKCTLIESKRIAHLSTSVTTSLLQYELDDTISELKQITSVENVIKSYKLGLKALKEIENFANKYGNNFDYIKRDALLYTSKTNEVKVIADEYTQRKDNGLDVEFIQNSNKYGFDIKAGLISKEGGAEIDPYKFTHELLEVAGSKNCKIYENTKCTNVVDKGEYVEVTTEYNYKIKAKKIIVATGYNTEMFTDRSFAQKTTTYNVATRPIDEIKLWQDKILIRDNDDPYNYLRTTKENRLIIGGEDESFIPGIYDEDLANKKYEILENRLKSQLKPYINLEFDYSSNENIRSLLENFMYYL